MRILLNDINKVDFFEAEGITIEKHINVCALTFKTTNTVIEIDFRYNKKSDNYESLYKDLSKDLVLFLTNNSKRCFLLDINHSINSEPLLIINRKRLNNDNRILDIFVYEYTFEEYINLSRTGEI